MSTNHRITASAALALALALGANAAPASASGAHRSLVPVSPAAPAPRPASKQTGPGNGQPAIVRVTASGGFHWGDAGIGALGGVAISMLAVGGTLVISQRRIRRPNNRNAITG